MFQRLQQKWKVNGLQVLLIICTFAIGGSLTGFAGKKLMNLLSIEQGWLWVIIYIGVITILWPFAVLIVSLFFGQYRFFTKYIGKIGRRIGIGKDLNNAKLAIGNKQQATTKTATNIAIFASGAGSNAQKIIDHFKNSDAVKISLIVCNKPGAGVLAIAAKENIPVLLIEKEKFFHGNAYIDELKEKKIDLIVLAGFLWKIPGRLIKTFPRKIINIHPALLPKFGGKGMYGNFVHQAVINAGEIESGITIHYVDEHYDNGDTIFQVRCAVLESDTPESLARRIHLLEHAHYPAIIEELTKTAE
jgi:formyltetrahydrofolate-dependent phosphoribosylglycinamide formyltransferase